MARKVFFGVSMSLDRFLAPGSLGDLMGPLVDGTAAVDIPAAVLPGELEARRGRRGRAATTTSRETFEPHRRERDGQAHVRRRASRCGRRRRRSTRRRLRRDARAARPWRRPGGTRFHASSTTASSRARPRPREGAGDRDVHIAGGGATILECVNAGLIDEFDRSSTSCCSAPEIRLFEGVGAWARGPGASPRGTDAAGSPT